MFRRLQTADWETIGKKLLLYARRRADYYSWRDGGTFELAVGQTIEDIVQEAIYRTCTGDRKWDPEKGSLDIWLMYQVKSLMDQLARSAPNRYETQRLNSLTSGTEDGAEEDALEYAPPEAARVTSAEETAIRQAEIQANFDLLLDAASGDEQLERMIELVWGGCEKDADIAQAMGIPVSQVYTLTRKLKRRVARKREQHG